MRKTLLTLLTAGILLGTSATYAHKDKDMEYCTITNKDGENVIKAGKADCNSMMNMNCKVGDNKNGDKHAAILVPKGQCDKIKAGNFSELTSTQADMIKSKLHMNKLEVTKP